VRRRSRFAAALLAGVAMLSVLSSITAPSAVALTSLTRVVAAKPALTVDPRHGGVVDTGGALTLDVSIANTGTGTLAAGSLYSSIDPTAITNATTLGERVTKPGTDSLIVGKATKTPVIPSGGEQHVTVTIAASALKSLFGATPVAGARVVAVQLRTGGATVAIGAAAFTVVGDGFSSTVTVGTIVPITAPATRTGLLSADELSDLTGEFGAWTEALTAVEGTQSVIALDPMVIASINALGTAAPTSAQDFLAGLRSLSNETFALPYGDSDVSLERAAGAKTVLPVTSLAGNLAPANFAGVPSATPTDTATTDPTTSPTPTPTATSSVAGVPTTAQLLQWDYSSTSIGWPYAGSVSTKDLQFLSASKDTTAVLSSADVKDTAARRAAGPLATVSASSALVADSTLSTLLATASGPASGRAEVGSPTALSQLIATLAIDASTGSAPTVLMTAPRVDEDTSTLNAVLTVLAGQTWIHSTDLDDLLAQKTKAKVALRTHAVAASRVTAAKPMLSADKDVRILSHAVTPVDTFVGPQRLKLLALLSNAWQGEKDWPSAAAATATSLESTATKQVTIKLSKTVTVLGSDSTLPVTIDNNLGQSVTVIVLGAPSNAKMTIGAGGRTTIPAGSVATVKLPVKVISNGKAELDLQVETPEGWKLSRETVAVTLNAGWETIGAVVITTALLLLFATGVYRNVTRRRRAVRRSAVRRAARGQDEG
jgi:Family of unknown function (DUF6049)